MTVSHHRRAVRAVPQALSAIAIAALLAGCLGSDDPPAPPPPEFAATIRTTSYGVPHVVADNFKGAGFGYGYAFAQQNFCLYAEELVTLRGERAQYFGGAGGYLGSLGTISGNVDSDFFYKLLLDKAQADRIRAGSSQAARDIVAGFAAGYNRYLSETGVANLPAECRNAEWVKPMTEDEAFLRLSQAAMAGSSMAFINSIGNARPPAASIALSQRSAKPAQRPTAAQLAASPTLMALRNLHDHTIGSNGYGLGKDVTQSGKGIVMGNPHFPWWGALRLHQIHVTVPSEKYDVMGATLLGVPLPLIGFNSSLGWTHTFSTDNRFTLRYLALDPANPTRYVKDGVSKPMTAVPLSIQVKGADGKLAPLTRTLYTTEWGPMIMDSSFAWSKSAAFALQDANYTNTKLIDQVILNGKATTVDGLLQAAATHTAMPWVNTMAADKNGDAMYFNYSVAANVANAQLDACVPGPESGAPFKALMASTGVVVMAGTTAACDWSGSIGATQRPSIKRSDYIVNANDSHWWSAANSFLTGFPKIIATGPDAEGSVQGERTRTGHAIVRDRLAGTDGLTGNRFTVANLQQIYQKSRLYRAEKWVPGFVTECLASASASAAAKDACTVLQSWDRSHAPTSSGAILFYEFYAALGELKAASWWSVPFNAADPLETPRGNAGTADALAKLETLVASTQFDSALKRRARPMDVQILSRPEGPLAIPGGRYAFNNWRGQKTEVAPGSFIYTADPKTNAGAYGNSYMQFVTWDDNGPVAEGILTYGQSSDPASPNFSDQTRKYAAGEWVKLPYTEAQIKADPNFKEVKISQ
ncbi:MAG: penicillin acylase family protein [Burkholderiaceae bacterium]|nr:penicillin acylase family protein [Burkholderiaceae bacterium]